MKVLFHTVNNMGLGHLRRTCAIIATLKRHMPSLQPLIVSNASFPALTESVPVPSVVLPHPRTAPSSAMGRLEGRVSSAEFQSLALNCIAAYKPKLTVFDTYVGGNLAARHRDYSEKSCLVFRKCREATVRQYVRTRLFSRFDLVVIPHSREEFCAGLPLPLVQAMEEAAECVYTGALIYPEPEPHPDDDLAKLINSIRDTTVVLVSCGGGGYDSIQNDFVRAALRGALQFGTRTDRQVSVLLVTGPFSRARIVEEGVITVREPVHVQYLMRNSDVVITHGGYNSVNEVLACGSRAIFTSFYRKTEDQHERIAALKWRQATAIVESESTSTEIADALARIVDLPKPYPEPFSGGDEIAKALTNLLLGDANREAPAPYCASLTWETLSELSENLGKGPDKVSVYIGSEDAATLSARLIDSLEYLEEIGIEPACVSFILDEDPTQWRLPALVKLLGAYRFDKLLGRVKNARELEASQIFFALEECRAQRPDFDYDFVPGDDD